MPSNKPAKMPAQKRGKPAVPASKGKPAQKRSVHQLTREEDEGAREAKKQKKDDGSKEWVEEKAANCQKRGEQYLQLVEKYHKLAAEQARHYKKWMDEVAKRQPRGEISQRFLVKLSDLEGIRKASPPWAIRTFPRSPIRSADAAGYLGL